MAHPAPSPSPSPSAGSSSSYHHLAHPHPHPPPNQHAHQPHQPPPRKLNPNSSAFSFLQPDQVPSYPQYPISNYHATTPYYPAYPIGAHKKQQGPPWNSQQQNGPSSSYQPYSHSHSHSHSHVHNSQLSQHSQPPSHVPYYPQYPPAPVPHAHSPQPAPPRASNGGIFLPLAHNGPHHLSSPAHSPYLASAPPIPLQTASNSPQLAHPAFSPQRPLAPAAIHTPHLATAPSLPVSPATPLPPPSIAATSFFPSSNSAAVASPGNPLSFSTAPRIPPSQVQPSLAPHQQAPAAGAASTSTASLSIAQPQPHQRVDDPSVPAASQRPARRQRKSRLPSPSRFAALTLGRGVKVPPGFGTLPVFPADDDLSQDAKQDEPASEDKTEVAGEEKKAEVIAPIAESKGDEAVEEKPQAAIVAEEKKEELHPAKPVEEAPTTPAPSSSSAAPAESTPKVETTPSEPAPAPTPTPKPASKMKSWADLVRPPPGLTPAATSSGVNPISASLASAPPPPTAAPVSSLLTALAAPPSHVHKPAPPLPRGLINNGNLCFANAILQALVYCGAFWETLRAVEAGSRADLRSGGQKGRSAVEAMIAFLAEFRNPSHNATSFDVPSGTPSAVPSSASSSTAADSSPLASTSASAFASSSSTRPSTSSSARTPFAASASSSSYPSLSPTPIHEALSSNPRFDAMRRGTQEDAEEFLGFFLETLSEEVAEIVKKEEERIEKLASASSTAASAAGGKNGGKDGKGKKRQEEYDEPIEEEEGWEEVGSKGRTATTRTTGDMKESPITKIFGGKSRSVLRCPGQKDSVTIEPFQRLQLDIQPDHVRTIEDALLNLTTPEPLPDYSTQRGTITQDATKQFTLDELPPVLILHLKRFLYDEHVGSQKCTKKIGYGTHLRIDEKVMSPARRNLAAAAGNGKGKEVARYELFGVVYHHGLQSSGGHYTVAVRSAYHAANWLELDDTHIRTLGPGEIAVNPSDSSSTGGGGGRRRWEATAAMRDREGMFGAEEEHKGAYLLMYARVDD